jgi:hypothetical protein
MQREMETTKITTEQKTKLSRDKEDTKSGMNPRHRVRSRSNDIKEVIYFFVIEHGNMRFTYIAIDRIIDIALFGSIWYTDITIRFAIAKSLGEVGSTVCHKHGAVLIGI